MLLNSFFAYAVLPGIIQSFTSTKKGILSLNLSLFLINQVFLYINDKVFLEFFCLAIFEKTLTRKFFQGLQTVYEVPTSYKSKWEYRTFWDDYQILMDAHNLKILKGEEIKSEEDEEINIFDGEKVTEP